MGEYMGERRDVQKNKPVVTVLISNSSALPLAFPEAVDNSAFHMYSALAFIMHCYSQNLTHSLSMQVR